MKQVPVCTCVRKIRNLICCYVKICLHFYIFTLTVMACVHTNVNHLHKWGIGLAVNITMVLIFDGNLEICAHVRRNLCHFSCLRHLIRPKAIANKFCSPKMPIFLHACAKRSELPSIIKTMKYYRQGPSKGMWGASFR